MRLKAAVWIMTFILLQLGRQQHAFSWRIIPQRAFWILRGGAVQEPSATEDLAEQRKPFPKLLNTYPVSACSIRGFRNYMEDDFALAPDFGAVFDGHGGKKVSLYLRQNLYAELQAALPKVMELQVNEPTGNESMIPEENDMESETSTEPSSTNTTAIKAVPTVENYQDTLRAALEKVDREVQKINHWSYQGSTVVAVWLHEQKKNHTIERTLLTANIGDSRAILSRNPTAVQLTRDHKPNDPGERDRIMALGGSVIWHGDTSSRGDPIPGTGLYRVNGNLALSRAIGDRSEKPLVSGEPDITITPLTEMDEFVLLATDGLWDVMSNADVVTFVRTLAKAAKEGAFEKDDIATMLVEEALRRGSFDNITVLIVWLQDDTSID